MSEQRTADDVGRSKLGNCPKCSSPGQLFVQDTAQRAPIVGQSKRARYVGHVMHEHASGQRSTCLLTKSDVSRLQPTTSDVVQAQVHNSEQSTCDNLSEQPTATADETKSEQPTAQVQTGKQSSLLLGQAVRIFRNLFGQATTK